MTATIAPSLFDADHYVADYAEHLVSRTHTVARLRRAGLSTDPALLDEAVRRFWMLSPERYEPALSALVVGARAVA